MEMIKIPGFTEAQRLWTKERDHYRCSFYSFNTITRKLERCTNTLELQIHHIVPRGAYAMWLHHKDIDINNGTNALTLCAMHHVCKGQDPDTFYWCVHPDTERARLARRVGDRNAFSKMIENRYSLNSSFIPYWRTAFDHLFSMIAIHRTHVFPYSFPSRNMPEYMRRNKDTQ